MKGDRCPTQGVLRVLIHYTTELALWNPVQLWLSHKPLPGPPAYGFSSQEGSLLLSPVRNDPQGGLMDVHSPIHSLPPEILGDIFMHCVPPRVSVCSIRKAPMLLCQVCSYWRELALSLPMLWSSFQASSRAGHFSLIQLWIERSRTQPLFLSLDLREQRSPTSYMVRLFLDNIHRWSTVTFYVDDNSVRDLLAIPGKKAHLLDNFGVNADKCTETMNDIPSILLSFPNLRRLRWCSQSTPTALLGMAFSSLTHIELLCSVPFNECIRFITRCPQICEIEISKVTPSPVPLNLPIVTLPHLSSFTVLRGINGMLDYFTLPSLRLLSLSDMKLRDFEDLVARSSCRLESFDLGGFYDPIEEEIMYYLRMPCLQSLRVLSISVETLTDQTLALLQYPMSSEPNLKDAILPHLEALSIEFCDTTDGLLSDMVASRYRPTGVSRNSDPPASLKWLDLTFKKKTQHVIDHSRLREFEANGLTVRAF